MSSADMAAFDQLPDWAREELRYSPREFSASELLPLVRGGSITPFNVKSVLSNALAAKRQQERRASAGGWH